VIRKTVVIAIVVACVAVIANDAWRYIEAQQRLRETTYTVARWAAENAPSQSRNEIVRQIVAQAAPSGVTITMYGQADTGVQVWTQTDVRGTIVAGTLLGLIRGKSLSEAPATSPIIKDYREAGIR
jgi:Flp pilus assembly protein TadG